MIKIIKESPGIKSLDAPHAAPDSEMSLFYAAINTLRVGNLHQQCLAKKLDHRMEKLRKEAQAQKVRLGTVQFKIEYPVDLDNLDMINRAKSALHQDLADAFKYNKLTDYIKVTQENLKLKTDDIPAFLQSK